MVYTVRNATVIMSGGLIRV